MGKWCNKHHKAGCRCGRHQYPGIEDAIIRAMERAKNEDGRVRLFPHEVLIYIEDQYFCHFDTIRRYMGKLAAAGKLVRRGKRQGYALAL